MVRKLAASLVAALALVSVSFAQSTWFVDTNGTPPGSGTSLDPYTSIQFAIDQGTTASGDTLEIRPGDYVENVVVDKDLILVGFAGPARTRVSPATSGPVLRAASTSVTIVGLTVTGGRDPAGDGIEVAFGASTSVLDCILRDNQRHGLFSDYDVSLERCTIVRNGQRGMIVTPFPNGLSAMHCIAVENGLEPDFGSHVGCVAWNMIDAGPFGDVPGSPSFWNPAADDFFLRADSDAIDAGHPFQTDPDGSRRDLGALPFEPQHPAQPSVYCTAKVNSQGCRPRIGSTGAATAAGAPFSITCADVLNRKSGLLFYGHEAKATPYQGGFLCVRAPTRRTALQNSGGNPPPDDCSGFYAYDFDARIQSARDPALTAGTAVYAQYWFRDPAHPMARTGRSDALYFLIGPWSTRPDFGARGPSRPESRIRRGTDGEGDGERDSLASSMRMRLALLLVVAGSICIGLATSCRSTVPNRDPLGEPLPTVEGESLDGQALRLPDDLAGAPAILILGYVQDAQFDADRWLYGLLQAETPVRVLEVPTIPGLFPRLLSGTIDAGMRSGIPSEDWGVVATVYGGGGAAELVEFTGNERPRNVRVLLLDGEGRVRFFHDRGFSAGTLQALDRRARELSAAD